MRKTKTKPNKTKVRKEITQPNNMLTVEKVHWTQRMFIDHGIFFKGHDYFISKLKPKRK